MIITISGTQFKTSTPFASPWSRFSRFPERQERTPIKIYVSPAESYELMGVPLMLLMLPVKKAGAELGVRSQRDQRTRPSRSPDRDGGGDVVDLRFHGEEVLAVSKGMSESFRAQECT